VSGGEEWESINYTKTNNWNQQLQGYRVKLSSKWVDGKKTEKP